MVNDVVPKGREPNKMGPRYACFLRRAGADYVP